MRVRCILLCLVLLSTSLAGCLSDDDDHGEDSHPFNGMTYDHASAAPGFTLTDQHGDAISLSDFEGKVVVVAFTYTHCPDVCLAIEANLNFIDGEMSDVSNLVLLSISIDPARDTPSHLLEWTTARGYDWTHLTSLNHSELTEVWDAYHLLVDSDHINSDHSEHNEESNMSHQVAILYPDNSSALLDGHHDMLPDENATGWNLTESTMAMHNYSLNYSVHETHGHSVTGINGVESPSDWSWWWSLYLWNETNASWEFSEDKGIDEVMMMHDTNHIAWAASNANISHLPMPEGAMDGDHDSHGDDGMEDEGEGEHEDEMYLVGHNTVTFIIDKDGNKRVVYTGSDWSTSDFMADLDYLLTE